MSLQCNVTLNTSSTTAGQNPAPQATLQVFNPNASAVVVTGVSISIATLQGQRQTASSPSVVPIGPGMTTVVPALSSITFGPFPIAVASAANVNSFQAVNQTGSLNPINPQPSQPPQQSLQVGALVYGSDGSINVAGVAPLLLSYYPPPPMGFQGGPLQFGAPNNLLLSLTTGVL